jgi:small subunit ribosomal protein S20
MRNLREAAEAGDAAQLDERHRELVRWLDRASSRGALHKNTAARRKAQAARVVSGQRD